MVKKFIPKGKLNFPVVEDHINKTKDQVDDPDAIEEGEE
jgi:hypothetical protein